MNSETSAFDRLDARREAESTGGSRTTEAFSALSIMLMTAQFAYAGLPPKRHLDLLGLELPGLHQSAQSAEAFLISETDVITALIEFHSQLVASQKELPPAAAEVLNANLWRMYE